MARANWKAPLALYHPTVCPKVRPLCRISLLEDRTHLVVVTGKLDVREVAANLPDDLDKPEPLEAEALEGLEEGQGADDRLIWTHAADMGAMIVTKDENLALRRMLEEVGPAVVWVRLGNKVLVSSERLHAYPTPKSHA